MNNNMPNLPQLPPLPTEIRLPDPARALRRPPDPEPDPLANTKYVGNAEQDLKEELTDLQKAYRKRAKNEDKRFKAAIDSEYWFCVCFESREAKESFLAAINHPEAEGDKYIDGRDLARSLNVTFDHE